MSEPDLRVDYGRVLERVGPALNMIQAVATERFQGPLDDASLGVVRKALIQAAVAGCRAGLEELADSSGGRINVGQFGPPVAPWDIDPSGRYGEDV
jgi:hypothetical protein